MLLDRKQEPREVRCKTFKERKDRGRKKRLPKFIDEERKIIPVNINRLLALSDCLLSLYFPGKLINLIFNLFINFNSIELLENNQKDRTCDYYH